MVTSSEIGILADRVVNGSGVRFPAVSCISSKTVFNLTGTSYFFIFLLSFSLNLGYFNLVFLTYWIAHSLKIAVVKRFYNKGDVKNYRIFYISNGAGVA